MIAHDHNSKLVRPVRELNMLPWWHIYFFNPKDWDCRKAKGSTSKNQGQTERAGWAETVFGYSKGKNNAAGAIMSGWIDKRDKHTLEINLYSYMNHSD